MSTHNSADDMMSPAAGDTAGRETIMAKARELAELFADSSEVDTYRKAEEQIAVNPHVQGLISTIKKKQKEAVAFEQTFKNKEMVKAIDEEIEALQNELDAIPIVSEFQETQSDLNYMLQLVMGAVRDTVSEKIQVEEGKVEVSRCD
ncbi:RicAFT regulatory complex protein RicA family protein [Paenibacillus mesotrionivorans]|uniref:RicAFT regulatory complex protein RicA family protein n=1 Tax=Paenibacillus mesotrionivorans TaxID=3160968 RepID=A0ACC7NQY9_9BACL